MSNEKEIMRRITSGFFKQRRSENNYEQSEYERHRPSLLRNVASEAPFALLAVGAIIFFVVFGLYELLFNSPIAEWVAKSWSSIMNASPQTVMALPKQIPAQDVLMQKTSNKGQN